MPIQYHRTYILLAALICNYGMCQSSPFEIILGENTIDEFAAKCTQLNSGSIYMMGHADTDSIGGTDLSLSKLDANGSLIWHKYFGSLDDDYCNFGLPTSDNCFLFGGQSYVGNTYALVVKTDTNGNEIWQHSIQDLSYQSGYHGVCEGFDSTYYICGFQSDTAAGIGNNIFLEKLDFNGNTIWSKNFGSATNDYGQSIAFTSDSNLVVVSDRQAPGLYYDIEVTKLDTAGNIIWNQHLANSTYNSGSQSIHEISGGNYLVVGESGLANGGAFDIALIKFSPNGTLLMDTLVIGTSGGEAGFDFVEDPSTKDLFIVGYGWDPSVSDNQLIFWQTDSVGTVKGKTFYGTIGGADIAYDIEQSVSNGFLFCGETNSTTKQYYLIYDSIPNPVTNSLPETISNELHLYPNPLESGSELHLSTALSGDLRIYAMDGQLVYTNRLINQTTVHIPNISSGAFMIEIECDGILYQEIICIR